MGEKETNAISKQKQVALFPCSNKKQKFIDIIYVHIFTKITFTGEMHNMIHHNLDFVPEII